MPHSRISFYSCWCAKCSHSWATRTDELPTMCPKCKTAAWDKDLNGNSVEMPDELPQPVLSKKDKRKAALPELGGMSTLILAPAIRPRADVSVLKGQKWADPLGKGNPCAQCMVAEGEAHEAYCSLF